MKFGLAPPDEIQTVDELEAYLRDFGTHVRSLDTPIRGGPRRHHYIPQFYLKRFANKQRRMIRIPLPVPSPPSRQVTHIKNLAVMRDFYTVLTTKGESALMEKLLSVWDHDASQCFQRLTNKGAWPISANLKLRIAFWIGLLFVRSPHSRRQAEAITELTAELVNSLRSDSDDAIDLDSIWRHQNDVIKLMISVTSHLVEDLAARQWQVVHFNSKDGLLLTDTGSFLVPGPSFRVSGTGVATAAEVLVPLDRHYLLSMHSFKGTREGLVELNADASPYLARHYNNMLISSAYQEVFCHQSDFAHVLPLAERYIPGPLMGVQGTTSENLQVDGVNTPPERRRPRRYRDYPSSS